MVLSQALLNFSFFPGLCKSLGEVLAEVQAEVRAKVRAETKILYCIVSLFDD